MVTVGCTVREEGGRREGGGREGEREGGRHRGREGGRKGRREGGREGGREGERDGERKGEGGEESARWKKGGRPYIHYCRTVHPEMCCDTLQGVLILNKT